MTPKGATAAGCRESSEPGEDALCVAAAYPLAHAVAKRIQAQMMEQSRIDSSLGLNDMTGAQRRDASIGDWMVKNSSIAQWFLKSSI